MNKSEIILSPLAKERLAEIAEYLYQQNLSKTFVIDYLNRFQDWLELVLGQFPESGTPTPEYGENIRRAVYQKFSFLYRINNQTVEILTIYRENLP